MIKSNRYFNNEAFGAAAANLAGLFQPPEAADVANYALADERRAKMNQLAWLFDNPDDPTASKRSSLTGVQGYGQTPEGFTYNVDRGYQAATENNVRDNARVLSEREMIEAAATQRLGIPDVNARYKVDSEAAVSGGNNLRDNQTKAITTLLGPLDPGQIRPEVAEDVMGLLEMPGIGPAAGAPKLMSETEQAAAERQRLIEAGVLTDDMLLDDFLGQRAPVQGVGPDGKTGAFLSPGAAIRTGAQPLPKDSGPSMSVTLPDGTVVQQGGKALTEGQSKDSVYFTRASGAIPKLDQYGEALTQITGRIGSATEQAGGNFIKSKEYQLAEQAGLEFLQAVLRKDTGAAITREEQSEYGRVYLPQPGDSAELLDQKKASRARALAAIRLGLPPDAIINAERAGVDLSVSAMPTEQTAPAASAEPTAPVYATNPQTGERLVLRNGNWEPAQ
ncbi:hypothetical protein H6M51_12500 [Rhizobium sp. AQ_MP]|uniref:hypothetical protein n=1 Tax=Rhizobium sp. AQ_MP TaxID=2761536 RepID=UPI00163B2BD6|nr:hypothetical protein [Rhizobium sp. AQ_MP]MBC2773686.1 hypothetical protein [Rhizobium sp. AQ_MP]